MMRKKSNRYRLGLMRAGRRNRLKIAERNMVNRYMFLEDALMRSNMTEADCSNITVDEVSGLPKYCLSASEYGEFLPIMNIDDAPFYNGKEPSYGGAQVWWSSGDYEDSTGNNYGCGVIAAANLVFLFGNTFSKVQAIV